MQNRRKFLAHAALLGLSPIMLNSLYACKREKSTMSNAMEKGFTIDQFGIQLWTVRDFMAEDAQNTLKSLGEYGYHQIESFQGDQGIFWGMEPQEFKNFLGDNGMQCISSHCDNNYAMDIKREDEFKKLVDDAASIGIKYLVNPWMGNLKTLDEFKQAAEDYNRLGKIAKSAGVQYAYHNHSYSFRKMEGEFPQDIMMQGTDSDLVEFEMDIYWVVNADQDPVAWLEKYPKRFTLSHIKDKYDDEKIVKMDGDPDSDENYSCVLGKGFIDFDRILTVAKEQGMKQWIVEQERYDGMTSMNAAEADADYMEQFLG